MKYLIEKPNQKTTGFINCDPCLMNEVKGNTYYVIYNELSNRNNFFSSTKRCIDINNEKLTWPPLMEWENSLLIMNSSIQSVKEEPEIINFNRYFASNQIYNDINKGKLTRTPSNELERSLLTMNPSNQLVKEEHEIVIFIFNLNTISSEDEYKAIDFLYDYIVPYLEAELFSTIDKIIEFINNSSVKLRILIALLTVTHNKRKYLKNRPSLIQVARKKGEEDKLSEKQINTILSGF